jgi:two-component system LytT family response regulator
MEEKIIKALIVDDEEDGRMILQTMLEKFCEGIEVVGLACDVQEAVEKATSLEPQLVFLDIEMPRGNGFNLFYHFDPVPFEVIFTTAYSQYAIKALRMAALDYLLKPIDIQELKASINRYREKLMEGSTDTKQEQFQLLQQQQDFSRLALPTQEGFQLINIDEIIRMQAEGSYTLFIMKGGEQLMVSKILKEYEALLQENETFVRVHRSHIINKKYIQKIIRSRNPIIEMVDSTQIGLSASKKDLIFKDLLGT